MHLLDSAEGDSGRSSDGYLMRACTTTSGTPKSVSASKDLLDHGTFVGRLAASKAFEYTTLSVIAAYAIWMGVDAELNDSTSLQDAHLAFVVIENVFCSYFFIEIIIRFLEYDMKLEAFRNRWFLFDTFLVSIMVVETWLPLLLAAGGGGGNPLDGLAFLGILRLLRLVRLRRLMRRIPELVTILKGIKAATRSVASVLLLLSLFDYVFACIFLGYYKEDLNLPGNQTACDLYDAGEGSPRACLSEAFFGTLSLAMFSLLCHGTLLDDTAGLIKMIREDSTVMLLVFLTFIVFASFTVLNMLIGILCKVVAVTSAEETEKRKKDVAREVITAAFAEIDQDGSMVISESEFDDMCSNTHVTATLHTTIGIDLPQLLEMKPIIFDGLNAQEGMTLDSFMRMLIKLRPLEPAREIDIQQFRTVIKKHGQLVVRYGGALLDRVQSCRALLETSTDQLHDVFLEMSAEDVVATASDQDLVEELQRRSSASNSKVV